MTAEAATWNELQDLRNSQYWHVENARTYNRCVDRLIEIVVAYGESRKEPHYKIEKRIQDAMDILERLCWATNTRLEETAKGPRKFGVIWEHRCDLVKEFNEKGYEGFEDFVFADDLVSIGAELVERPWLSSHYLEWVVVDALVCNEIRQFGYTIIVNALTDTQTAFLKDRYMFIAADHMNQVNKIAGQALIYWWLVRLCIFLVIPGAIIWAGARFNMDWAIMTGSLIIAGYLAWTVQSIFRSAFAGITGKPPKKTKLSYQLELWYRMKNAYAMLTGPVVDPSAAKKALEDAASHGAIWNGAIYAILNRVIARDPGAWVTDDLHTFQGREDLI